MEESESKPSPEPSNQLTVIAPPGAVRIGPAIPAAFVVPAVIGDAGDRAAKRFLEFFAATIRNKNTRMAYYRACVRFFDWC